MCDIMETHTDPDLTPSCGRCCVEGTSKSTITDGTGASATAAGSAAAHTEDASGNRPQLSAERRVAARQPEVSRGVPAETVEDLNLLSSRGNAGANPAVVDLATRGMPTWDHLQFPKSALDAPMAERR